MEAADPHGERTSLAPSRTSRSITSPSPHQGSEQDAPPDSGATTASQPSATTPSPMGNVTPSPSHGPEPSRSSPFPQQHSVSFEESAQAEDERRASVASQMSSDGTRSASAASTTATAPGDVPSAPPLAVLIYMGFCEMAVFEDYGLLFAAELHSAARKEHREVELHLSATSVVFCDAHSKRELRCFPLLSINVVAAVQVANPAVAPCLCIVRHRAETERSYVHIFSLPEVGHSAISFSFSKGHEYLMDLVLLWCVWPERLRQWPKL